MRHISERERASDGGDVKNAIRARELCFIVPLGFVVVLMCVGIHGCIQSRIGYMRVHLLCANNPSESGCPQFLEEERRQRQADDAAQKADDQNFLANYWRH